MEALKNIFSLLKETVDEWRDDRASRLAASLAYYTIFSLGPILLLVIVITGQVFGTENARNELFSQIEDIAGEQTAEMLQTMVDNVQQSGGGVLATLIGVGTLFYGATGAFQQLQSALNIVWDVAPKPGTGVTWMLRKRALTFLMIPLIGLLLLTSLIIDTALSAATGTVADWLPSVAFGYVLQVFSFLLFFAGITVLFAAIYKILPDVVITWKDVWVGAALTALLFSVGRYLISLYLARSSTASTYGAAGSLIVIMLWIYYSANILFFGAELTQVWARRHGTQILPDEDAIRLTSRDRFRLGVPHRKDMDEAQREAEGDQPQAKGAQAEPPPSPAKKGRSRTGVSVAVTAVLAFVAGAMAAFLGRGEGEQGAG